MFETRNKLRRYEAACHHYEDQLLKLKHMLKETEDLLSYVRQLNDNLEEINDALATENRRISENHDVDNELMDDMWCECRKAINSQRELETLQDENYRLWMENVLLKGELAKLAPAALDEIGRYR